MQKIRARKMITVLVYFVLILLCIGAGLFFFKAQRSQEAQFESYDTSKGLKPCPGKPNCVCSQFTDDTAEVNRIEPMLIESQFLTSSDGIKRLMTNISKTLAEMDISITEKRADYVRGKAYSSIFGFVDDIEILVRGDKIHFRSASRVGYSDLNANRKRVERLKALLSKNLK